jgi:hypothetical protein
MIGSIHRKDLSVRTPSLAGTAITGFNHSMHAVSYVHLSNPNPQKGKKKFNGVREAGYHSLHASPSASKAAGLTLIHTPHNSSKFGKRVYMGSYQMTDKDVFDLHM